MEHMAKKHKVRLRAARSKTKNQEQIFLDKAARLTDHPEYLIPECDDKGGFFGGPFTKLKKQLDQVYQSREDLPRMKRLTSKGEHIPRAYAGMVMFHLEKKTPSILTGFPTPWGDEVKYIRVGNVNPRTLVGVQHFEDPRLRLFAFMDLVRKKGLTIYSFEKRMVAYTAQHALDPPPKEFIDFVVKKISPRLNRDLSCSHLNKGAIQQGSSKESYLEIGWKTADNKIYLCRHCTEETNTFGEISQYVVSPEFRQHFDINYHYTLQCKTPGCPCQDFLVNDPGLKELYLKLKLSDEQYISETEKKIKEELLKADQNLFIHGSRCFGADMEAFLGSLKPDDLTLRALTVALKEHKGAVLVSDQSPAQLLQELWEETGEKVLCEFTTDSGEAQRIFKESREKNILPIRAIRLSLDRKRFEEIDKALPGYTSLPVKAAFADRIAREYKFNGKDSAIRELASSKTEGTAALSFAFHLCFATAGTVEWKYSKEQMDYAGFLRKFVSQLLEAEGEEYHFALQAVVQAAGSTEKVPEPVT
jgi:hypothetical protein